MAGSDRDMIEARLIGARAERMAIAFAPGMPVHPFSVGTNGQWRVVAEGVGPVHLFLGFDGQRVHVAAASPGLPVLLGGSPVASGWVTAPVPCEIRFGTARLAFGRAAPDSDLSPVESDPSTVSDGGALYQAAQRAVLAAKASSPPGPPLTAGASRFASTMLMEQRPSLPAGGTPVPKAPVPQAPMISSAPLAAGTELQDSALPAESKKNYWQAASPVKKVTLVLMPFALVFSYLMLREPPRPAPRVLAPANTQAQRRAALDAGAGASSSAPSPGGLVAPAVEAGVVTTQPQAPVATPSEPAAAAHSAAASPSKPLSGSGKPGKHTPEREALDGVASGAFDDAARAYDTLAASHPDDPAFKEAARILRAKAGHVH